jgi:hypothetical protein
MAEQIPIRYLSIFEFVEAGYLQEVNRRFLHPLGLALEVNVDIDDDTHTLSGVWDYRDDPEGIYFGEVDAEKARRIDSELQARGTARFAALGYIMQPIS